MSALKQLMMEMGGMDLIGFIVISASLSHRNQEIKWDKEKETIDTNVLGFLAMNGINAPIGIRTRVTAFP